jgi:hypothetical protein
MFFSARIDPSQAPLIGGLFPRKIDPQSAFGAANMLFGGQLANMDPEQAAKILATFNQFLQTYPDGPEAALRMLAEAAKQAEKAGLDPGQVALRIMTYTMPAAEAWRQMAGRMGYKGLSPQQAAELEAKLNIRASKSVVGNTVGATMALLDQGLIRPGSPAYQLAMTIKSNPSAVPPHMLLPNQWLQVMVASGVPANIATMQLNNTDVNTEYVVEHNLTPVVRQAQATYDIIPYLHNHFTVGATAALQSFPVPYPTAAGMASMISGTMLSALQSLPPEAITADRSKLFQMLTNRMLEMNPALSSLGPGLYSIVSTAWNYADNVIRKDPRTSEYGNLKSMITMSLRPDIRSAANLFGAAGSIAAEQALDTAWYTRMSPWHRALHYLGSGGADFTGALLALSGALGKDEANKLMADASRALQNPQQSNPFWSTLSPGQQSAIRQEHQKMLESVQGGGFVRPGMMTTTTTEGK